MEDKFILQVTINGNFYELYFDSKYINFFDEYKNCFYKTKDLEYIINLEILKNYYSLNQFNQILINLFDSCEITIKTKYEEKEINDLLKSINLLTKKKSLFEHFNVNNLNYEKNIDLYNNIYNQYFVSKINRVLINQAGINIFDYIKKDKVKVNK